MNRFSISLAALLASAAAAHAATPDFSGVWQIATPVTAITATDGSAPPLLPASKALHDKFLAQKAKNDLTFDPAQKCKPLGIPRIQLEGDAFKIVQNNKQLWFFYAWNNQVRWVNLNVKPDASAFTTFFGTNTGTFTGANLTIQGQLFNDVTLLDDSGLPHSDMLTTSELYQLSSDGKQLNETVTFTDPKIFSKPWQAQFTFNKLPTDRLGVNVCEDHVDTSKFY